MSDSASHPNVAELSAGAVQLEDDQLRSLMDVVQAELSRRETMRRGLDVGERLQFDTVIDMIRQRTGFVEADALAMIRAHEPGRVRGAS